MGRLGSFRKNYGLELNTPKTKVMIVDGQNNNLPHFHRIAGFEFVPQFIYLCASMTNAGGWKQRFEIITKTATTKLNIWRDSAITRNTKLRLLNSLILPIASFASKTWTVRETTKQIEANGWSIWNVGNLRTSWTLHGTNVSILNELYPQRSASLFSNTLAKLIEKTTLSNVVEGKINGPRGRTPKWWVDQITPNWRHLAWSSSHGLESRPMVSQIMHDHQSLPRVMD